MDARTRQRTGREIALTAETRQGAVDELLGLLQVNAREARIDPTRSMVQLPADLWTIVGGAQSSPPTDDPAALRRAGAKHRRVR